MSQMTVGVFCQRRAKQILEEGDDRFLREKARENWQVCYLPCFKVCQRGSKVYIVRSLRGL